MTVYSSPDKAPDPKCEGAFHVTVTCPLVAVTPVIDGDDGSVSMLRSCIDGPVMDGSRVKWELVGQVPEVQG